MEPGALHRALEDGYLPEEDGDDLQCAHRGSRVRELTQAYRVARLNRRSENPRNGGMFQVFDRDRGRRRTRGEGPLGELATTVSELELRLRGWSCGGNGWRACGKARKAETGQEGADDLGLADHGNDLTPSRASWTRLSALADDQPGLRALAG